MCDGIGTRRPPSAGVASESVERAPENRAVSAEQAGPRKLLKTMLLTEFGGNLSWR
jgi:hypothetical protein